MTEAELHDWALGRYGSEVLACKFAIVRQMHADVQLAEHHSDLTDGVKRPAAVIHLPS